jgi:hypothetical protein
MGHVGVARFLVPLEESSANILASASNGRIDELVLAKLKKMGVLPSPVADDATFLRRVYLDTIGALPDADDVGAFLADHDSEKRRRAIDDLLGRSEFADY